MSSLEGSCDEVVKSLVYFFGKVLPSSQMEGEWTLDSIERGLGWALYCENAAKDPHLRCSLITYLNSKPFEEAYTIEDVARSRVLLISNLFVNQLLSEDVSQALVRISAKELGEKETKTILHYSREKLTHYRSSIQTLRSKPFENAFVEFKVRLLIESIAANSISYEALNSLLKGDNNLALLLDLSRTLEIKERNKLFTCLGCWIKEEFKQENYKLFHHIASLSVQHVEYLCQTFPGLHFKILEIMQTYGRPLSSKDIENCRSNSVFKSIVKMCHQFLMSDKLQIETKKAFSSWISFRDAHFWHFVFTEAQKPQSGEEIE